MKFLKTFFNLSIQSQTERPRRKTRLTAENNLSSTVLKNAIKNYGNVEGGKMIFGKTF
jgi:hypothetical protein